MGLFGEKWELSTENIEVATKAKPFLRKTKFILEKNRKIKILGGFVKNGMACMARKKLLFLLVGMAYWYYYYLWYIFFLFVGQGGRKEIIKQFFKL